MKIELFDAAVDHFASEYGLHDGGNVEDLVGRVLADDVGRYLLVEKGRAGVWFTDHATVDAAAACAIDQECPEDWDPLGMVDLHTGELFEADLSVRFVATGGTVALRDDESDEDKDEDRLTPEQIEAYHAELLANGGRMGPALQKIRSTEP